MTPTKSFCFLSRLSLILVVVSSYMSCKPATETSEQRQAKIAFAEQFSSLGWPNLHGPMRNNVSYEIDLDWEWPNAIPRELWRGQVGTGYGSPVVVENHVIVLHRLSDEELIESFHPETGESQWQFRYPTSFVCKYDYSSGPYSTPVIDGDRVYAIGGQGQLHCLQLEDGSLVWTRSLGEEYEIAEQLFCVGASPLVINDRIILNLGSVQNDAGVIAIDKTTGETFWTATDHAASYATPLAATIHDRQFVFVVTHDGILSLDPQTGEVFWDYPMNPNMSMTVNASSPLVVDDRVLMSTGPGPGTVCLRVLPDGGYEEVWRDRRVLDSQYNSLVYIDGYLYGFSSLMRGGSSFRCVELTTDDKKRLHWEFPSKLRRGQAIAVDGRFIILGEFGHLAVMDVNPNKPILRSMSESPVLKQPCYSAPALYRGLLYLRNEGTILCFDLRRRKQTE